MIKNNVISFIVQFLGTCLHGSGKHLIKTFALHATGNDSSKILKRDLHRIIEPCHQHKEHKEGKDTDLSFCKKRSAYNCGRTDTDLKDNGCGIDIYSHLKLGKERFLLHIPDLAFQFIHIYVFGIVCPEISHGFQTFLYPVSHGKLDCRVLTDRILFRSRTGDYDDKCHGNDPETCKHHSPVKGKEKAYSHYSHRYHGSYELRDPVTRSCLYLCAVPHDIRCKIRDILFAEIRQWKLSKPFGYRRSPDAALSVRRKESRIILYEVCHRYEKDNDNGTYCIKRNSFPCKCPLQKIFYQTI